MKLWYRFRRDEGKQLSRRHRKDTFYNALRPVLIGARIIGLMPITGACERDVRRLKFNWCSAAAITSFIIMLWILFNVVLGLRVISESGFGLQNAGETV